MLNMNKTTVDLYEIIKSLTNSVDLLDQELSNHNKQVAYLAFKIGEKLNLTSDDCKNLILSGLLHDIGALTYDERISLLDDEEHINVDEHAFKGAQLLKEFQPLYEISGIIKYHHMPWNNGEGKSFLDEDISILSHILHLADRVVIKINIDEEIQGQTKNIVGKILEQNNDVFAPEVVEAFIDISDQENIWMNLVNKSLSNIIQNMIVFDSIQLDVAEVIKLTKIFSKIIDFRSKQTASYTASVAKTAERLAKLCGLSNHECEIILVSAYLSRFGKLVKGNDMTEKTNELYSDEFKKMKIQAYDTYMKLRSINGFEYVNSWEYNNQVILNEKRYQLYSKPENLPLDFRIMAVANIFITITEKYSNIRRMKEKIVELLKSMVDDGSICPFVVSELIDNFDMVNKIRENAQSESLIEYSNFIKGINIASIIAG